MAGRGTHLLHLLTYQASRPVPGGGVRSRVGETVERYGGLLGRLADIPERGGEAGRSGTTFNGLVACRGHPESASVASLRLFTSAGIRTTGAGNAVPGDPASLPGRCGPRSRCWSRPPRTQSEGLRSRAPLASSRAERH